jgi:hypothetical protein
MTQAGGFRPTTWLPAGLVLLVLLAASVIGQRRVMPDGRAARLALGSLAAFTAWCYLSIAWSDAPGPSLEASNLLLVSLLSAWTLSLAPWRSATVQGFFLCFSAAAALVCLGALISAPGTSDLTTKFTGSRFGAPLDYPNTTAAFAFMSALPALVYAARPGGWLPLRILFQAVAAFLCGYALLPQSRGSILGAAAALLVLAVAVPFRWRMVFHLGVVVVVMVVFAPHASELYETARTTGRVSPVLRDLLGTLLLLSAGAGLAGGGLVYAGDRVRLTGTRQTWVWRSGFIATSLAVLAVAAVAVQHRSGISDALSDQWHALQHPGSVFEGAVADGDVSGRLNSIDPLERYDYWRVSVDGFGSNPIGGMGAGGFVHRYQIDRRYDKPSTYPHNLALKVLGDTGLVGLALMVAYLTGVLALLRRLRGASVEEAALRATALAVLAYFLLHGMFDWLEAYPVLVGPALAFPLVALAARGRDERLASVVTGLAQRSAPAARRRAAPPRLRPVAYAGGGLLAVLACVALAGPWVALRYSDRAVEAARVDAEQAYHDLDRAAGANPFDPQPLVSRGVLALTHGELDMARSSFNRALDREQTWLPHFGLGLLEASQHEVIAAQAQFAQAWRLNRKSEPLRTAMAKALKPGSPTPAALLSEALANPLVTEKSVR